MEHHIDQQLTERIEGKTYRMFWRTELKHNIVTGNLRAIFANWLKSHPCHAIAASFDVLLDEENLYVPDVMIVCDRLRVQRDGLHGAPDLAVEVLSPATIYRDRNTKMRHYAAAGTKEYWLVSPREKSVEVYHNTNGHFELDGVYVNYPDWYLALMDDDERAAVRWEIPVSLYDDFFVSVKECFDDVDDFE